MPEPYSDSSIGVGDGDAAWELMALTWQHVDLDAGIVSVERSPVAARQGVGDYDPEES